MKEIFKTDLLCSILASLFLAIGKLFWIFNFEWKCVLIPVWIGAFIFIILGIANWIIKIAEGES